MAGDILWGCFVKINTIVHIGQHKTGTTSIQHYLRTHKAELSSRGLFVPTSIAGHDHPSHYVLNIYALDSHRMSSMKEKLLKEKGDSYLKSLRESIPEEIKKIYTSATQENCKEIIWTNEGLYLLNSISEYKKIYELFSPYSSRITCVCCFREAKSYQQSHRKQLLKQGISLSDDKDSYRYLEDDSWLLDHARKKEILHQVFDEVITFPYNPINSISEFLHNIKYPEDTEKTASIRLNVTDTYDFSE